MRRDRWAAIAFVLGLVGGLTTLVEATRTKWTYSALGFSETQYLGLFGDLSFDVVVAAAILMILGAALAFRRPSKGLSWGILTIASSALAMATFTYFSFGTILAMTGGALAIIAGTVREAEIPRASP